MKILFFVEECNLIYVSLRIKILCTQLSTRKFRNVKGEWWLGDEIINLKKGEVELDEKSREIRWIIYKKRERYWRNRFF
jgi:hypothetical protein